MDGSGTRTWEIHDPQGAATPLLAQAFNAVGWRTHLDDTLGTTTFAHDDLGRLTNVTDAANNSVGYQYNARGQRTQISYPDGSTVVDYTYAADGQMETVVLGSETLAHSTYDAVGRLQTTTRADGSGPTTTYTYDAADRLTAIETMQDTTTTSRFAYTLNRRGERTQATETTLVAAGQPTLTRVISYTYDGLGRLTDGTPTAGNDYTFTFDAVGNITVAQVNRAETRSDSYNPANQMNAATYDAAGNLTGYGSGDSYEYDALHRLVRNTNAATSYHYNGDGVLMAAATGGITTTYTQDVAVALPQILTDGTHTHIYGLDRLASVDGIGTRTWEIHDALGSVRQHLAADGSVVPGGSYAYTPFGVVAGGNMPAPFGFTGELHSEGLVYLRARWYDPAVGTFTARDPFAGFPETPYSLHPYQYAYADPVRFTDPSGEQVWVDAYPSFVTFPKDEKWTVPPTALFFNEKSARYFSERILGGDPDRPLHWEPGALDILKDQRRDEENKLTLAIILLGAGIGFASGSAANAGYITAGVAGTVSGIAGASSATAAYNAQYLSVLDPNGTIQAIEVFTFMQRAINGILRETKDYRDRHEDEHTGCETLSLPVEPWIAFWFSKPKLSQGERNYILHTYYMYPSDESPNGYLTYPAKIPVSKFIYDSLKVKENGTGIGTDEDFFPPLLSNDEDQHRFK